MARVARSSSPSIPWAYVAVAVVTLWVVLALFPFWVGVRLPFESDEHRNERVGHWFGQDGMVMGRVVDRFGRPYAGAHLMLTQMPFKTKGSIVRRFQADDDGEYRSGGLPRGRYRIEFESFDVTQHGGATIRATKLRKGDHRQVPDLIAP